MPWWITSENVESAHSFNIKLWNTLELWEKRELLCSYNQVVNPNIRDLYSAGGKITHVNGKRLSSPVAQVFNIIVDYSDDIKAMLTHPSSEMYMMIKEFNPTLLKHENMYDAWLDVCCGFAEEYDVPLREWIKKKPSFLFSK